MGSLNKFKLFLGIFIPFFAIFVMSHNTSALTLTPNNVVFDYNTSSQGSFSWSGYKNIPGQNQPVGSDSYISPVHLVKHLQFSYQPLTIQGTHASLHFEANVVFVRNSFMNDDYTKWLNLSEQEITSCFSNSTRLNIENQSLSYAQTWWDWNGFYNTRNTLTIYGDVTFSGLTNGAINQSIYCTFGQSSDTFVFFDSEFPNDTSFYVEQIPSSIVFTNDLNNALLSQQIAQQEVQIQLQTQMNDKIDDLSSQSQQNTQDIIDNQNQNTHDIIKSNQKCVPYDETFSSDDIDESGKMLNSSGDRISVNGLGIIDYVPFYPSSTFEISLTFSGNNTSLCQYDKNKFLISCIAYQNRNSFSFTSAANTEYLSLSIPINSSARIRALSEDNIVCKNINEEYYDEQRQADQNISNQNSSDIQGAENQQTTNLIGVLSNFLTQLRSFQATNCNLSLPFPEFIGGTQVVNICQGKDVLGNFITIIGTLAMVSFYIPLALVLLKMIYNEIRSFTNG